MKKITRLVVPLVTVGLLLITGGRAAGKKGPVRAYVQSGPDGIFYARCVPPAAGEGAKAAGRTTVYQVEGEHDRVLDRYDWYAPGGVALGWSPLAGKVAVAAMFDVVPDAAGEWRGQEQLRFAMGGKLLKGYTASDLIALGAAERVADSVGRRGAALRLVACEQVPETNEYDFVVAVGDGVMLRFDITTGELRAPR